MAINIEVKDKVDPNVASSFERIAAAARRAYGDIERINSLIRGMNSGALKGISKEAAAASRAMAGAEVAQAAAATARTKQLREEYRTEMVRLEMLKKKALAAEEIANKRRARVLADAKAENDQVRLAAQRRFIAQDEYIKAQQRMAKLKGDEADARKRQISADAAQVDLTNKRTASNVKTAQAQTAQAEARVKQSAAANALAVNNILGQHTATTASNVLTRDAANTAAAKSLADKRAADAIAADNRRTGTADINANRRRQTADAEAKAAQLAAQQIAAAQARTAAAAARAAASQSRASAAASAMRAAAARASATIDRLAAAHNRARAAASQHAGAMDTLQRKCSFLRSDGLRWAKTLAALGGASLTAHHLVDMADGYTRLQNRLSTVAEPMEMVNQLTDKMFKIANNARAPVQELTTTFVRLDLAISQSGGTMDEAARMTETLAKALKLTGATSSETRSAMIQMSQAFNKGKLDGDEFRSMMENAPIVVDNIAKALNVTRGELLKMAPEGKITADIMRKGLAGAAAVVDEKFAKLKWTIGDAFQVLRNNLMQTFGEFDKAVGITATIASGIALLSANLNILGGALIFILPLILALLAPRIWGVLALASALLAKAGLAVLRLRGPVAGLAIVLSGVITRFSMLALAALSATARFSAFLAVNAALSARAVAGIALNAVWAASWRGLGVAAATAGRMMIAAFSFGPILLALTAILGIAAAFGDQMIVNTQTGVTFGDVVLGAVQELGAFFGDTIVTMANAFMDFTGLGEADFKSFTDVLMAGITAFAKGVAFGFDWILTVMMNVWRNAKAAAQWFIKGVDDLFTTIFNGWAMLINEVFGYFTGKPLVVTMKYRLEPEEGFGFTPEQTVGRDALDLFGDRVNERALQRRQQKQKEAAAQAALRTGTSPTGGNDEEEEKLKKRLELIEAFRREQQNAIDLAFDLEPTREINQAMMGLIEQLRSQKLAPLGDGEKQTLRNLVAERVETERLASVTKELHDEYRSEPNFDRMEKALGALYRSNAVSAKFYARKTYELAEARKEAEDASYGVVKAMQEEMALQGVYGKQLVIEQKLLEIRKRAEAIGELPLFESNESDLRVELTLMQQQIDMEAARKEAYDATIGQAEVLAQKQATLNWLYEQGGVSLSSYRQQLWGIKAEQLGLNAAMSDSVGILGFAQLGFANFMAQMPAYGIAIADMIQGSLTSAVDGIAAAIADVATNTRELKAQMEQDLGRSVTTAEVLTEKFRQLGQTIVQEAISAVVKLGIQLALQSVFKSLIAKKDVAVALLATKATTAAQVTAMTAIATAAAPAAAAVSLATAGGNSVPAMTGITSTFGLTKSLSALAAFADGGYVAGKGTSRSDSIPARLSNGEFVVNADATKRNLGLLQAVNSGKSIAAKNTRGAGGMKVTVVNNAGGVAHSVERISADEIRITARQEAQKLLATQAGAIVAREMDNPNSQMSKSLTRNTTAVRKRS